ncbi:MAG TPA: ABC transporter permease [Blastocatellia bacterium]|nr:ABC transporter permease [Blastocatellia bacterium]
MEELLQDLRYGFRMLLKSPGFTGAAVLALALGIGANTAIFSVVDAVLLRPLPYPEPDQLMVLREFKLPVHPEFPVAPGNFLEWQNQSSTFESLCAYRGASYNLVSGSTPQRIQAARVSAGLITALGTPPAIGRDFLAEEDQEGRGNVVVLSHGLWQRQFGADPNIVGQTITLSGVVHIVVGVMPPSFRFPDDATEIWTPPCTRSG